MKKPGTALVLGFALACSGLMAQPAAPPLPPPAAFYSDPAFEAFRLSPSGRWLALSAVADNGRVRLAVFDLQQWKVHAVVASYDDADVASFYWVGEERLVYTLTDRKRGGGDQLFHPGLFSVHRDGSASRTLVKLRQAVVSTSRSIGREALDEQHRLLWVPDDGSEEVIVGEPGFDSAGDRSHVAPRRLNIVTGVSRRLDIEVPDHAFGWRFDPSGEPRVAITHRGGRSKVLWRDPGDRKWRTLSEHPAYSAPFHPQFVTAEGRLYVTAPSGVDGAQELARFDFATLRPRQPVEVSTPGFDFSGSFVREKRAAAALGVRVLTDAETTVWTDPRMAALQKEADRQLPGRVNRIDCRRCGRDDMIAVVHGWADADPGQLWVYDAQREPRWRKLLDQRPGMDAQRMARTSFHRVKARDGLELPVWITRPAGKAGEPLPAVLLVHGGPWVRGRTWAWDADAQFLASRGYVVIEPEFRGSTGYGQRLYQAGLKQWGAAMQDDLADALAWAVSERMVDPGRVCIAGASYGGYATLMGLVRHSELYRCGVAWVAVTDPQLLFEWSARSDLSAESREHSYPHLLGDLKSDPQRLAEISPVEQAAKIRAPVLLAHGAQDQRVLLEHGTRMRDALRAAGHAPEWVLYADEGHGWYKLSTRVDFAQRVEAFLARHLK